MYRSLGEEHTEALRSIAIRKLKKRKASKWLIKLRRLLRLSVRVELQDE